MKKFLIGTTALAAVAVAAPAFAKDVTLSTGGYMRVGVGFTTADDTDIVIMRDGEIHFKGKGTLDNGITIDARVELEAFTTGDTIDDNYLTVSSDFGKVLFGGIADAFGNIGYVGFTSTFVNHAVTDGTYDFTGAGIGTAAGASDGIGIQYYTPTIAGFQAGISYQPSTSNDGSEDLVIDGTDVVGVDGTGDAQSVIGGANDVIAFGAAYSNSFGDIDLTLGGGYRTSETADDEWLIGTEIGFSGFQLNLRYDEPNDGDTIYAVGGNYATGPWAFGAGYATQDETQRVSVGANYTLGDGVTAGAGMEWGDDGTDDGLAGALLLGVSF